MNCEYRVVIDHGRTKEFFTFQNHRIAIKVFDHAKKEGKNVRIDYRLGYAIPWFKYR